MSFTVSDAAANQRAAFIQNKVSAGNQSDALFACGQVNTIYLFMENNKCC